MSLNWEMKHGDLQKDETYHRIFSSAAVSICDENSKILLSFIENGEYYQSSRSVLVDAANKLEHLAREMKSQADKMR
jgi:hypothetical protein